MGNETIINYQVGQQDKTTLAANALCYLTHISSLPLLIHVGLIATALIQFAGRNYLSG